MHRHFHLKQEKNLHINLPQNAMKHIIKNSCLSVFKVETLRRNVELCDTRVLEQKRSLCKLLQKPVFAWLCNVAFHHLDSISHNSPGSHWACAVLFTFGGVSSRAWCSLANLSP